ncbi:hypothetical protein AB0301_08730 [Microbacterium profundi]|uniref:Uncharacterized protein n=1 Tax=Microbacterium profundi TaxID=450380 RepID=A0ABV3LGV3_9MICO|nr:hypothetical protein [Microbacterium profundi]MCE7483745.1 hypothetical protein [Microbacterium profundi]
MAKYTINRGSSHPKQIEADTYRLVDGFFWFYDEKNNSVLTYKAEAVSSIWLEADAT